MPESRHDARTDEPTAADAVLESAPGAPGTSSELVALLYRELRGLAHAMMSKCLPGMTLQPTALVHEAYLRLSVRPGVVWDHPGHFFGAAARAMRQILVEERRRKGARKHGGDLMRAELNEEALPIEPPSIDLLALDRVLDELEGHDPRRYQVVMLRYFAGLSSKETAEALGLSLRTVERDWTFARTYLYARLEDA